MSPRPCSRCCASAPPPRGWPTWSASARASEQIFRDWFDTAAADPADGYTSEDYAEHISTEFSTFRWLLEPMLAAVGFEIVTADFEGQLYGAYTCVKSPDRDDGASDQPQ